MFCTNCGANVPDGSKFCTSCGKPIADTVQPVVEQPAVAQPIIEQPAVAQPIVPDYAAYQNGAVAQSAQPVKSKKKKVGIIIGAVCGGASVLFIALIAIIVVAMGSIGKADLNSELLRDWQRVEESDGSYYTLVLDFSSDTYDENCGTIDYDFDGYYYDSNIASYNYEVISKNEVEIDGYTYTIEFNDEGTMMTMTPALTSSDACEYWYNWD